eukprot:CAMPEP_0117683318 /NCGR_PEP_ID=MMETSP0804-20121206/20310_1 /TAXON_ID=1074897 /ORGANISM="Tetraselmis astigmatica, Strain CCMP880" /LENGTH=30 /DNA_ID= /DNA_START= /DNA_END= /DNA_ORIENTATION=
MTLGALPPVIEIPSGGLCSGVHEGGHSYAA